MFKAITPLLLALCVALPAYAAQPAAGETAPDFALQDQNGKMHSLTDYTGKWVVLYFYPKDDTPGCTTEACAFRDDIFKFRKMGVSILGVSLDDVESHAAFAEKYSLPFPLLADVEKEAATAYGVLKNYGLMKVASRQTFVIAPDGTVARHYAKVDPDSHSEQLQADVARLMQAKDEGVEDNEEV